MNCSVNYEEDEERETTLTARSLSERGQIPSQTSQECVEDSTKSYSMKSYLATDRRVGDGQTASRCNLDGQTTSRCNLDGQTTSRCNLDGQTASRCNLDGQTASRCNLDSTCRPRVYVISTRLRPRVDVMDAYTYA